MSKLVTLRKSGNSLILTAPADLKNEVGRQYSVDKRSDGSIIYQPTTKRIFLITRIGYSMTTKRT